MRSWPSLTAEAVCLARALEGHHPQSALDDPYAVQFLRRGARLASHRILASALDPHGLLASISLRHAWLDDRLREAIPQVQALLILGAGYDSRCWRLPLDGRIAVEIDHPATQRRKRRKVDALRLPPRANFLAADLANEPLDKVLERSPLPRGAPIAIAWEGVSMYLERQDVVSTLTALAKFAGPGSRLVFDLWRPTVDSAYRAIIESGGGLGLRLLGEPLRFACHARDAPALLEPTGWKVERTSDVGTLARARGRIAYPDLILVEASIP